MKWFNWNPALTDELITVKDVLSSLPESPLGIPKEIEKLENPNSLFRINGATNIVEHDIIHIILGRGLLSQDEAFVIGFTIGNSSKADAYDRLLFKIFSSKYPEPFNFNEEHIKIFNHGFDCGSELPTKDIALLNPKMFLSLPIVKAREEQGINIKMLKKWYTKEVRITPATKESNRLIKTYKL